MDRFHVIFAIIAAGWIAISAGMHARWMQELQENERLRETCGLHE